MIFREEIKDPLEKLCLWGSCGKAVAKLIHLASVPSPELRQL